MSYGRSPIAEWAAAGTPPPRLSVSEWADRFRVLPEASAARGGRWRTTTAPFLRGIMDAVLEPGVRKIALMKCHQSGGSEAVNNIVGFAIEHAPAPMLLVHPTAAAAEAFSKERLGDMIRTTPALRAVVQDKRLPGVDGRPESTLSLKMFPGGFLALGGANTPNTFARWAVRLAIGDDVDRFPAVVGEEGDPADLLVNRTTTFHDGLAIFVSTPTLKGGRIDVLYARSDQRRYVVTCPGCGREDWITWSDAAHFRVAFDERDPMTARIQCPDAEHGGCGRRIAEPERAALIASGTWRPTTTAEERGLIGFHVPAMLSPWVSLGDLVAKFLTAHSGGRESLRVFINTSLAEGWEDEDRSIRIGPAGGLMNQREAYEALPHAASWITCAIDVQDDRYELLFCAWGGREECWVLHHEVLTREEGFDPYAQGSWDRLYRALVGDQAVRFDHVAGVKLPVNTICVDSGFQTMHAYRFTRLARARIFATKGMATIADGHFIKFSEDRDSGSRVRRGVPLVLVNTDVGKQRIADRVREGRIHFPVADWCSEEFFEQLQAETYEPVFNPAGVRVGGKWTKQRARNEILDLLVLNLAAKAIRGTQDLDRYRAQVGLPAMTEDAGR